jgi:hypothetical protein
MNLINQLSYVLFVLWKKKFVCHILCKKREKVCVSLIFLNSLCPVFFLLRRPWGALKSFRSFGSNVDALNLHNLLYYSNSNRYATQCL